MSKQRCDEMIYNGKEYSLESATLADIFSDDMHRSSPLAPLLETNDLRKYFASPYMGFHSANGRGYLCDWEIKEDRLYLTSFTSRSSMLHSVNQLLGKESPAYSIQHIMEEQRIQKIREEFEKQYGSIDDLEKEKQKIHHPLSAWSNEMAIKGTKKAYAKMQDDCCAISRYDPFSETDETVTFAEWFSGSIKMKEFNDYEGNINGLNVDIVNGIITNQTPCHVRPYYRRPLKNYIEE